MVSRPLKLDQIIYLWDSLPRNINESKLGLITKKISKDVVCAPFNMH